MKLVNFDDGRGVDIFFQCPLSPRLVGNQRLQHGPDHVQLGRAGTDVSSGHCQLVPKKSTVSATSCITTQNSCGSPLVRIVLLPLECRVVVWLDTPDPVGAGLSDGQDDAPDQVFAVLDGLAKRLSQVFLNKVLQLLVDVATDGVCEHRLHPGHQHL